LRAERALGSRTMARFDADSAEEVRELRGRYPWMILVAALAFLALLGRLWHLQMIEGDEYAQLSASNFLHRVPIPAPRGFIRDHTGKPLAENRDAYNVVVTPAFLPNPKPFLRTLARVLDLGDDETKSLHARAEKTIAEAQSVQHLPAIPIRKSLTKDMEKRLFEAAIDLEGVEVRDDFDGRAAYIALSSYPSKVRVLRLLREFLSLKPERYERIAARVLSAKGLDVFEELRVVPDIHRGELRVLTINQELLPGVRVQAAKHRAYPTRDRAAHAIGYTKEITDPELAKLKERGYRMGDYLGKIGIERLFEKYLRGQDGEEHVVVDSKGRIKDDERSREMLREHERRDAVPGHTVVLSLDRDLNEVAADAIAPHAAAAVLALDPKTGFLLSLAAKPSVDLNRLASRISRRELLEMEMNPLKPLVSRALMETYFPGSTYKLITAIAALEAETITPHTRHSCGGSLYYGRRFGCHRSWGHGSVDLVRGMATSCDVYFYRLGMSVGLDVLHDTSRKYGFGEKTGLGFSESTGFIPNKDWYRKQNNGYYPAGQDLNNAIGQGDTKVTLLQLALAYAAAANGGNLLKPQIVLRIESNDGKRLIDFPPVVRRKTDLSPEHFKWIQKAICSVTQAPFGTAHYRRLREHVVCGKTGTAQRGKNITKKDFQKTYWEKDDALFVGYSPADNPEVLVAAVVEHGGHGASIAMPIVNKVVKAYFDLKAARAAAAQSQAWTPPELLPPKTPKGVAASQDRFLLTTGSTQSPSSPR
jgi:penicillin-binding protein 2